MMLPGNGCPLSGSISVIGLPLESVKPEKLPVLQGTGATVGLSRSCTELPREVSYEKKKNVLFRPSYIFGIQTGPPMVPPGKCWMPVCRALEKKLRARNQGVE